MKNKIFALGLLSVFSFNILAADLDFKAVDSDKIDKQPVYNEVIQLLTKEEKEKNLQEKIAFLKADIEKWKKYQADLNQLKTEYEQAFKDNEIKIAAFNKEIEDLKNQIKNEDINKYDNKNTINDVNNNKQNSVVRSKLEKKPFDNKKDTVAAEIEKTTKALEEDTKLAGLKAKKDADLKIKQEQLAKAKEAERINDEKIKAEKEALVKQNILKEKKAEIIVGKNKPEIDKKEVNASVKAVDSGEPDKNMKPILQNKQIVDSTPIVKDEVKIDDKKISKTIDEQKKEITDNKKQLVDTSKKIDTLTTAIVKSTDSITEQSKEIDIGTKMLADSSIKDEIVEFNLRNGKKIKLIKHTVFPGESLSGIVKKTFETNYTPKYTEIEFRMNTIRKLNKDLVNQDQIKAGQVIYIPFFKL